MIYLTKIVTTSDSTKSYQQFYYFFKRFVYYSIFEETAKCYTKRYNTENIGYGAYVPLYCFPHI